MSFIEKIKLIRRAWLYRLRSDAGEISYLLNKVPEGSVVFDIGAHKGAYTYWMQKAAGNEGKVISFEPQQKGFTFLRALVKTMRWQNVIVENLALSNLISEKTLFIKKQALSISYEASLENKYADNFMEEKVSTITINDYCKRKNMVPSFIKIDVEGHEWEVLQGAEEILQEYHPAILLECEARHIGKEKVIQCFNYLKSLGYNSSFVYKNSRRPLSEFDFNKHQNQTTDKFWRSPDYCNNFIFEFIG
ncbi:MAG: FkbM family methyltransferase [Sphingobacteriales bacterium]|nr:FkbM family methyltransferase [Sphingobacteriales bacterium]